MLLVRLFGSALHPGCAVRHSLPDLRASAGEAVSFCLPQYFHCDFASCVLNPLITAYTTAHGVAAYQGGSCSASGAQIEFALGCLPAQTVHAAIPITSIPISVQTRMFSHLRIEPLDQFLLNSIHSLPHPIRNIPWQRCIMQLRRESLAIGQDPS